MTTRASEVVSAFLSGKAKRLSPPHIASSQRAEAHVGIVRRVFLFLLLLSSFSFSSLCLKNGTYRDIFSLFSHTARAAPNNQAVYFCKTHSPFLSFSKTRGPVGFAELRSFPAAHSRLGFSRVGFANQNSTASAELSGFLGERNGRKPRRITAFWPSDVTYDVISATKPISGEFLSESGDGIL